MTDRIRVLVADDHRSARAAVRAILEEESDFEVCAEAGDARGAVRLALAERPDICLLDVDMPGGGIKAAAEISEALPETVVVMLTVSGEDSDLFDSLRAGATGYLLKDTDPDRFPADLRGALDGEGTLSRSLVGRVIGQFRNNSRRRVSLEDGGAASLTSREWQVLELLQKNTTTAEIAKQLFVSPVTVRRHIGEILKKLRVPNRAAALRLLGEA
jgi:DNA-binding NarL/FixJ family response regulator